MPDMRNCMSEPKCKKDICIDALRILDSCKDKDCFEDTPLLLTDFGQDIIDRAGAIRVKSTKTVGVNIDTEPVTFNKGFYQILWGSPAPPLRREHLRLHQNSRNSVR